MTHDSTPEKIEIDNRLDLADSAQIIIIKANLDSGNKVWNLSFLVLFPLEI